MINLFSQAKRMTNDRVEKNFCASSNHIQFSFTNFMPNNHKENEKNTIKWMGYTYAMTQLLYVLLNIYCDSSTSFFFEIF